MDVVRMCHSYREFNDMIFSGDDDGSRGCRRSGYERARQRAREQEGMYGVYVIRIERVLIRSLSPSDAAFLWELNEVPLTILCSRLPCSVHAQRRNLTSDRIFLSL